MTLIITYICLLSFPKNIDTPLTLLGPCSPPPIGWGLGEVLSALPEALGWGLGKDFTPASAPLTPSSWFYQETSGLLVPDAHQSFQTLLVQESSLRSHLLPASHAPPSSAGISPAHMIRYTAPHSCPSPTVLRFPFWLTGVARELSWEFSATHWVPAHLQVCCFYPGWWVARGLVDRLQSCSFFSRGPRWHSPAF